MTTPFTIYVGNEVVADMHVRTAADVRIYQPVQAEYHLGGSHVFNAASIANEITRLGLNGRVSILGTISKDVFGQHLIDNCADLGIDTRHVVRVDESTLLAIVTHGKDNNSFYFPNAESNAMLATNPDHLPDLPAEEHKMFLMQGVCSAMKPSGKHWLRFAQGINDNTLIVYDVNARPSLIHNLQAHRKLIDSWAAAASVIKISDADIGIVYADQNSFEKVASRFLRFGTNLVVETRGHKSVRVLSQHGVQEFAIPKLMGITNTVGAGDNFMAGLTLAFAKAGIFSPDAMSGMSKDDVGTMVETAIRTASEHLLRQNPQAACAPAAA